MLSRPSALALVGSAVAHDRAHAWRTAIVIVAVGLGYRCSSVYELGGAVRVGPGGSAGSGCAVWSWWAVLVAVLAGAIGGVARSLEVVELEHGVGCRGALRVLGHGGHPQIATHEESCEERAVEVRRQGLPIEDCRLGL